MRFGRFIIFCEVFCTLLSALLYFSSFHPCIVCPFLLYVFFSPLYCLSLSPLRLLFTLVLSVPFSFTSSFHPCIVCPFLLYVFFSPLYCLSLSPLRLLINHLVYSNLTSNVTRHLTDRILQENKYFFTAIYLFFVF